MSKKLIGIYKFTNKLNNKIYIGSAVDLYKRKHKHLYDLRHNAHHNKHLQRSWDKYGEENFIYEIIEYIDDENNLKIREQYWIDKLNVCDINIGYNILPIAGNSLGYKMSEEDKKKIGDSCRGEKNYGTKLTDAQVYKIKELFIEGLSNKEIALLFEVNTNCIHRIKIGETWKHIKVEGFIEGKKGLTDEQIIEIKKMIQDGIKTKDIVNLTGINKRRIYGIKNGTYWSHLNVSNLPISQAEFIYLDKNNINEIIDVKGGE